MFIIIVTDRAYYFFISVPNDSVADNAILENMTTRILIVEDEKEIADTLCYSLMSAGRQTNWVANGTDALVALYAESYDLCILDVGLPDYNGFELLKELRMSEGSNRDLPVIFLTARSEEIDRIVGLEIGAADYVCKPFSPREVVARVKVIIKRTRASTNVSATANPDSNDGADLNENPFRQNHSNYTIDYHDTAMPLTRAEYELMATMVAQPSRVFTRRQLIENIWASNHPSDDRAIDTHIKTLRAKLKTLNPHKEFIITHRGFGYSLEI
jgi:two-component system catabolic regulation response regulator CreB